MGTASTAIHWLLGTRGKVCLHRGANVSGLGVFTPIWPFQQRGHPQAGGLVDVVSLVLAHVYRTFRVSKMGALQADLTRSSGR